MNKKKKSKKDSSSSVVSHFDVPVIKKMQKGKVYYSGEMSLSALKAVTHVDCYDSNDPTKLLSAQRSKTNPNAKAFSKFITIDENVCFSEILLNHRDGDIEFISLREMGVEVPHNRKLETMTGILRIPSDSVSYVYDGGTRRKGYISILDADLELMGTEDYKEIKNFNVPFSLSEVSAEEETRFFLNHNGKQKKVSSDHRAIVAFHANKEYKVVKNQTDEEYLHSLIAGACFEMVGDRLNPWYKKIIMADTEKDAKRLVTVAGFKTGLKSFVRFLNKDYWSPETTDGDKSKDIADITTTFWRAVKKTCPKMWRYQDDYIISASQGVSIFSMLMGNLYKEFFNMSTEWNIENICEELKKSSLIRSPQKWLKGGDINKEGGGYKALGDVSFRIYKQIKGIR
jgi:DGQHR domain-containing protein